LVPKHVPKVYHQDANMRLVAMQYLGNHLILRKGMIGSTIYPHIAKHIAAFLAETLFKTSSFYLSSREKRELEQKFNTNHDLCKLTEDLIFTFPYFEQESNHKFQKMEQVAKVVRKDRAFKEKVLDLKYLFMNQKDALVHGDLHTGSIMVNKNETFVIDPEFAFFGPFGFDIGAFMGNLLLSSISHQVLDEKKEYSEWVLEAFQEFWVTFEKLFLEKLSSQKQSALITPSFFDAKSLQSYFRSTLRKILQQSIGFAGCKMARRILGLAGVADIRGIADEHLRFKAEERSLLLAVQLVKHHDTISSLNDVLEITRGGK
ncbi:MAG: S-methyl-5-thioribose kinase, partial [Chlamydiae bacterium]|nr:S-methyl-5-thioribose kinase [Chlamydiota bacterium]